MSLRPNVFIRAMAVSLSNAFITLNHRCNNLNEQYEEDHCNGVDRCIGHAWNIAVCHGVCGCQAGSTRHATGNGSQQVENTDLKTNLPTTTAINMGSNVMAAPTPNKSQPLS